MTHAEWFDKFRDAAEDAVNQAKEWALSHEAFDRLADILDAEPVNAQTARLCTCPACGAEHARREEG